MDMKTRRCIVCFSPFDYEHDLVCAVQYVPARKVHQILPLKRFGESTLYFYCEPIKLAQQRQFHKDSRCFIHADCRMLLRRYPEINPEVRRKLSIEDIFRLGQIVDNLYPPRIGVLDDERAKRIFVPCLSKHVEDGKDFGMATEASWLLQQCWSKLPLEVFTIIAAYLHSCLPLRSFVIVPWVFHFVTQLTFHVIKRPLSTPFDNVGQMLSSTSEVQDQLPAYVCSVDEEYDYQKLCDDISKGLSMLFDKHSIGVFSTEAFGDSNRPERLAFQEHSSVLKLRFLNNASKARELRNNPLLQTLTAPDPRDRPPNDTIDDADLVPECQFRLGGESIRNWKRLKHLSGRDFRNGVVVCCARKSSWSIYPMKDVDSGFSEGVEKLFGLAFVWISFKLSISEEIADVWIRYLPSDKLSSITLVILTTKGHVWVFGPCLKESERENCRYYRLRGVQGESSTGSVQSMAFDSRGIGSLDVGTKFAVRHRRTSAESCSYETATMQETNPPTGILFRSPPESIKVSNVDWYCMEACLSEEPHSATTFFVENERGRLCLGIRFKLSDDILELGQCIGKENESTPASQPKRMRFQLLTHRGVEVLYNVVFDDSIPAHGCCQESVISLVKGCRFEFWFSMDGAFIYGYHTMS